MRSVRDPELEEPLSRALDSLRQENESMYIRDRGEFGVVIATLLVGKDYEEYAEWQRQRAREAVDKIRSAFADVPDDELERMVNDAVREVRNKGYATRTAS